MVVSDILKSLDEMAMKLGDIAFKTNKTIRIEQPNIGLAVKYSKPENLDILAVENIKRNLGVNIFPITNKENLDGISRNNNLRIDDVYVASKVPEEAFKNKSLVIYSYLFRDDTFFHDKQQLKSLKKDETPRSSISSAVLAVTVGIEKVGNLTTPIVFKFKKLRTKDGQQINEGEVINNLCTFWNPDVGELYIHTFIIFIWVVIVD